MAQNDPYSGLSWNDLRRIGKENNLYTMGMGKKDLINILKKNRVLEVSEEDDTQEEVVENNNPTPVAKGFTIFQSLEPATRSGGRRDPNRMKRLEVSINKEKWNGERIEVDNAYVDDVRRLLKAGGYIFSEVEGA